MRLDDAIRAGRSAWFGEPCGHKESIDEIGVCSACVKALTPEK